MISFQSSPKCLQSDPHVMEVRHGPASGLAQIKCNHLLLFYCPPHSLLFRESLIENIYTKNAGRFRPFEHSFAEQLRFSILDGKFWDTKIFHHRWSYYSTNRI